MIKETTTTTTNQIKKGLLLSLPVKFCLNRRIFGKVTSKNVVVSCTFFVFYQCVGQAHKVHETTTLLLVTLTNIHRIKKITVAILETFVVLSVLLLLCMYIF